MPSLTNSSLGNLPSSNKNQSASPETSSTAGTKAPKSVAKVTENIQSLSLKQQVSRTTVADVKLDIVRITLKQLIQKEKEQISQFTSHLSKLQSRVSQCTISRANCEIDNERQLEKKRNNVEAVVKESEKMESFKRRLKNFEKVEEELVRHVKNIQIERLEIANNRLQVFKDLLIKISA